MKFLLNTAFLTLLALGVAEGKGDHASDMQMEDLTYWRELVNEVDSFPATASPTASPTLAPVPVTDPPTEPPVEPCKTICTFEYNLLSFLFFSENFFLTIVDLLHSTF